MTFQTAMTNHNQNSLDLNRDLIEHVLLAILPHGSGIDCNWNFDWFDNGKVRASNSFHCMNDAGMYDGYADFSLVIPVVQPMSAFRLAFHGATAHRKARRYDLRDCLAETIYHALDGSAAPSILNVLYAFNLYRAGRAVESLDVPDLVRAAIASFKE